MNTDSKSERPLILVVDDDPVTISLYTQLFQGIHGFEVLSATNSEEAIHLVETLTRPAVLILDRKLCDSAGRRVYGEDLLVEMMKQTRFPLIPILHSGDTSVASHLKAIRSGALWYFPKAGNQELFVAHVWLALTVARLLIEPNEDPLTGALNRKAMFDRVVRELSRAKRKGSTTACLLYDVDKLKLVNDTYGHPTGDNVIVSVARSIRDHLRPTDVVCRYGGDEILVFIFDVEEGWLERFTQSSCLAISEKKVLIGGDDKSQKSVSVSASVGWTILSSSQIEVAVEQGMSEMSHSQTLEQVQSFVLRSLVERMIEEADISMYQRKEANRQV